MSKNKRDLIRCRLAWGWAVAALMIVMDLCVLASLARADCASPGCFECGAAVVWTGSQTQGACYQMSPNGCHASAAFSYASPLGGGCAAHSTITTQFTSCPVTSMDCADNSTSGLYCCTPGDSCIDPMTIPRGFCASGTPPCGVAGSWNEYMDAYGGSCD